MSSSVPTPVGSGVRSADDWKIFGNAAYTGRHFKQAIERYSRGILIQPDNPILYSNRAAAWMGIKRWEEARYDCKVALEIDPTFEKARVRLATIAKESSLTPGETVTFIDGPIDADPASPSPSLVFRSDLNGCGRGLVASRDIDAGEELFTSHAAALVYDDATPNGRASQELLHTTMIAATIDPLKHAALQSVYPYTDAQVMSLPMFSLQDTAPEEMDAFERLSAASPDTHPGLIIPPYTRFTRLTCGRFTPRQIHFLHHQVTYNCFELGASSTDPNVGNGVTRPSGCALYPSSTYLNHSCWPNAFGAVLAGEEQRQVIRATTKIKQGEEVTIAYINHMATRGTRRKRIAETYEFVCRCERCTRTPSSDAPSSSHAASAATVALSAGSLADDLLESIFCLSPTCTGPTSLRDTRGRMVRHFASDDLDAAQGDPLECVRVASSNDTFVCRDCHHAVPAVEVDQRLQTLQSSFDAARREYQLHPNDSLQATLGRFKQIRVEAEKSLIKPTHHLLQPLYSAIGGLYCRQALQSGATPAERSTSMANAREAASQAYHGTRKVVGDVSVILLPLLLTLAACCDPAETTRMDCVNEAMRIHTLHFGGGVELFQLRYAKDLDRLQITREAMQQAKDDEETSGQLAEIQIEEL